MIRCADIEDALLGGRAFSGPEVEGHLSGCASCRELLGSESEVGGSLRASFPDAPPGALHEVRGLFEAIARDVEAERGPRAFLRSRTTRVQRLGLTAIALGAPICLAFIAPRADLFGEGPIRPLSIAIAIAAALVSIAALSAAIWPIHRRALPRSFEAGLISLAVVLPILPVLAAAWVGVAAGSGALPATPVPCLVEGLALTIPVGAAAWYGARALVGNAALLLSAGASLSAFLALSVICGESHPGHLLLGHAAVVWVAVAGTGLYGALRLRRT